MMPAWRLIMLQWIPILVNLAKKTTPLSMSPGVNRTGGGILMRAPFTTRLGAAMVKIIWWFKGAA